MTGKSPAAWSKDGEQSMRRIWLKRFGVRAGVRQQSSCALLLLGLDPIHKSKIRQQNNRCSPSMKKILAAAGSALILLFPALSSAQTAPAVVKNIKTDFGATCNGVSDDSRAFASFIAWAKQRHSGLIELELPS